jgi:predicted flap endonuclease-1-like 5' DNA nuclease
VAAAPAKAELPPVAADGKPQLLTVAREGGPDDLKQIKGVGPKLEEALHRMGIYHLEQVASWRAAEVAWVDDNLEGFKGRVSRDDWVTQARLLTGNGETAFFKKVEDGAVY